MNQRVLIPTLDITEETIIEENENSFDYLENSNNRNNGRRNIKITLYNQKSLICHITCGVIIVGCFVYSIINSVSSIYHCFYEPF